MKSKLNKIGILFVAILVMALVFSVAACQKPSTDPTATGGSPIAAIQADISGLQEELDGLQSTLANMDTPAQLGKDIVAVEVELEDLAEDVEVLKSVEPVDLNTLNSIQADVASAEALLGEVSAEVGQQVVFITELQTSVSELYSITTALNDRIDNISGGTPTDLTDIKANIAALEGRAATLENKLNAVEEVTAVTTEALSNIMSEIAALEESILNVGVLDIVELEEAVASINVSLLDISEYFNVFDVRVTNLEYIYDDIVVRPYASIVKLMNSYLEMSVYTSGEYVVCVELYGTGLTTGTLTLTTGYGITEYLYGSGGSNLKLFIKPDDNMWTKGEEVEITFNGLLVDIAGVSAVYLN